MANTVETKSSEVKTLMNAGSMRVELRVEGKLAYARTTLYGSGFYEGSSYLWVVRKVIQNG